MATEGRRVLPITTTEEAEMNIISTIIERMGHTAEDCDGSVARCTCPTVFELEGR